MNGGSPLWRRIQPPLAFTIGALTLAHELFIHDHEQRPYVLLVAVTLMGFASFLRADQVLRRLGVSVTVGGQGAQNQSGTSPSEGEGAGP